MKKIGFVAALSLLAAAGVMMMGCGSGGVSCDFKIAGIHECETYDASVDATAANAACTAEGGTSGACPSASALGTCTLTSGGVSGSVTFYSDGSAKTTAAQAEAACKADSGTWAAGS